jgi:hypothetical protein
MPREDSCPICGRSVLVTEELGWARVQVCETVKLWPDYECVPHEFFVHMECLRTKPLLPDQPD